MKTITITIADPQEVKAAAIAEFGDELPFICLDSELKWRIHIWNSVSKSIVAGAGETPEEAFDKIRAALSAEISESKLHKQAAALGLKLVPADQ